MAGAGYKLFNTGDVLTAAQVNTYLMEQTVMVFADAAARTTALSGVVSEGMISYLKDTNAVEVYDGSNWVSSDDPNAIQNSIIAAKGDLIAGSANDTPAILSVGSNGDTLVADSAASTGLRWQGSRAAGKNPVINGAFDIWQRGTSFAGASTNTYTADRWNIYIGTSPTSWTFSRQSAGLTGFQYCMRFQRNNGATETTGGAIGTSIEIADATYFAGQTVTLSFWARVGANYSQSSSTVTVSLKSGTGTTDANGIYNTYTGEASVISQNATLTTSWQRFSYTGTIGTSATQLALQFNRGASGTAGANDWLDITGVQIEVGSVATQFTRTGGTLQGETALAQRYYYRLNAAGLSNYAVFGTGWANTTGNCIIHCQFPVTMRVKPTAVDTSAVSKFAIEYSNAAAITSLTSISLDSNYSNPNNGVIEVGKSAAFTVNQQYRLNGNNDSGAYIGWSAEL